MDMNDQDESRNVEDVRGSSGGGGFRPVHGISLGTVAVALIAGWVFGINPLQLLGLLSGGGGPTVQTGPAAPSTPVDPNDPQVKFVSQILRSTEQVWSDVFQAMGQSYQEPKLRLYRDSYPTACGEGEAAAGPFYCPNDRIVYLDLSFFDLMTQQLGAPGQFAHAYVIGHEVGHHVQNLLGVMQRVGGRPSEGATGTSVRLELQADCFAGVWGNRSQAQLNWLQAGDVDAALNAASSVGDDALQKQSRGYAVPDSFTHGTSAQRSRWFKTGFASGDINSCDTFGAAAL